MRCNLYATIQLRLRGLPICAAPGSGMDSVWKFRDKLMTPPEGDLWIEPEGFSEKPKQPQQPTPRRSAHSCFPLWHLVASWSASFAPASEEDDDRTATHAIFHEAATTVSAQEVSLSDDEETTTASSMFACQQTAVCACCDNQVRRDWRFCAHCGMYLEHSTRRAAVLVCEAPPPLTDEQLAQYTLETPRDEDEGVLEHERGRKEIPNEVGKGGRGTTRKGNFLENRLSHGSILHDSTLGRYTMESPEDMIPLQNTKEILSAEIIQESKHVEVANEDHLAESPCLTNDFFLEQTEQHTFDTQLEDEEDCEITNRSDNMQDGQKENDIIENSLLMNEPLHCETLLPIVEAESDELREESYDSLSTEMKESLPLLHQDPIVEIPSTEIREDPHTDLSVEIDVSSYSCNPLEEMPLDDNRLLEVGEKMTNPSLSPQLDHCDDSFQLVQDDLLFELE